MTTFAQVLARLLAAEPGRPLVTFYDDATGERTELSVTTYANWVAKTSSLLADELELGAGDRLLVDLPPHWLGTVVLGAAWTVGLEVVWDDAHDAVVTGPEGVARWAAEADRLPVVASALLPLAGRFPDGLPADVHDLGVEVWSQPDAYVAWPGADDDTPAVEGMTHGELWAAAAAAGTDRGDRVLSEANPASAEGLPALTGALAGHGSLVLVVHASPERRDRIADDERVTGR
ncbi:MAG: TIGR03089 family protein [Nocardioides sp.]